MVYPNSSYEMKVVLREAFFQENVAISCPFEAKFNGNMERACAPYENDLRMSHSAVVVSQEKLRLCIS